MIDIRRFPRAYLTNIDYKFKELCKHFKIKSHVDCKNKSSRYTFNDKSTIINIDNDLLINILCYETLNRNQQLVLDCLYNYIDAVKTDEQLKDQGKPDTFQVNLDMNGIKCNNCNTWSSLSAISCDKCNLIFKK